MDYKKFWDEKSEKFGRNAVIGDYGLGTHTMFNFLTRNFNFKDKVILDAGVGVGRLLPVFFEKGREAKKVYGIDVSPKMLEFAKLQAEAMGQKDNIELTEASLLSLPFPDNYFDFVNCITVLCHIADTLDFEQALRELCRVTKYGLFIIDPTSIENDSINNPDWNYFIRPRDSYRYDLEGYGFDYRFMDDYYFGRIEDGDSLRTAMYFTKRVETE